MTAEYVAKMIRNYIKEIRHDEIENDANMYNSFLERDLHNSRVYYAIDVLSDLANAFDHMDE